MGGGSDLSDPIYMSKNAWSGIFSSDEDYDGGFILNYLSYYIFIGRFDLSVDDVYNKLLETKNVEDLSGCILNNHMKNSDISIQGILNVLAP